MTAEPSTPDSRVRQAGYGLSAAAAVSILFLLAPSNDAVRLIQIGAVAAVILLILAVLGALSARTGKAALYLATGLLALAAAVLQLIQFGRDTNWIGGNGSTVAWLAGLGIGFAALWYVSHSARRSD
jgi:hypothetical protein